MNFRSVRSCQILLIGFSLCFLSQGLKAATITSVGVEEGVASNGYAPQFWAKPTVAKSYDLAGEKYGTAGYYYIRPTLSSSPTNVSESAALGNNLGITASNNPTLYLAPAFVGSITGGAGTFVNFGGYPITYGPNGGTVAYRQGALSVPVNRGQTNNTPSGLNSGNFGEAFSFTMGSNNMSVDFRIGVGVDTAGSASFAPDFLSLYSGSAGTVFSSQLSRNGSMDMAFFDVTAGAGESFVAAVWKLTTNTNSDVAPFCLITFDVARYKFDVSSGTQTNSVALGGDPSALVKTGDGTLVITSSNSYGGGTLISAGALQVLSGGSVAGNITNNATLNFDGAHGGIANVISGTGALVKSGAGIATLYTASTYTGATVVSAGQLMLGGSGSISNSSGLEVAAGASVNLTGFYADNNTNRTINGLTGAGIVYGGGGTLTVNKTAGMTDIFSGDIQGGQGLIKSGAGILTLSGSNSYTGGTLISEGTLDLDGGSVKGGITNNAILTIQGDLVNAVSGTGSLIKAGSAEANVWNPTTYTGPTVVQSGTLRLDGSGSISANSALQVDAGATFLTTGFFLTSNNVTVAGLTGAGTVQGAAGTLTISKPTNTSDIFTGKIQGGIGVTLAGSTQIWFAGSNNYLGRTVVGSDNVLNVVDAHGLGSTAAGTTISSGGVLRLQGTNGGGNGITVEAEALTISGQGRGGSGGALRSVSGTNTWQGAITLAADARIGAASSSTLTLDVASGNALTSADFNLTTEGAGNIQVNDPINLGSGGLTKFGTGSLILVASNSYSGATTVNEGTLVVAQSAFTATITPTTISVTLSNTPSGGDTFAIVPGSLSGAYGTPTVHNLGQGQSASFDASTGILSILQGSTGPTFEDAYPGEVSMTDFAPNGLTYLVNYAFGGSSTNPAKLPMQDTSDPSKLTLVAYIRTNNASGTLSVVGEKGATLDSWDTNNPIAGVAAQDQSDAPNGTEKRIFSTPNSGDRLFLRLKATLQP